MTEKEFREKMKELGWEDEYIEDCIRMYNFELSLGIEIMPLEKYISRKSFINNSS